MTGSGGGGRVAASAPKRRPWCHGVPEAGWAGQVWQAWRALRGVSRQRLLEPATAVTRQRL